MGEPYISPVLNIHACMGESCYCKPGNEAKWRWSDDDKERLMKVIQGLKAIEHDRTSGCDTGMGNGLGRESI